MGRKQSRRQGTHFVSRCLCRKRDIQGEDWRREERKKQPSSKTLHPSLEEEGRNGGKRGIMPAIRIGEGPERKRGRPSLP